MSLINDALKRVSEAERGKPAQQTDFETRSLQPAEYERRSSPVLWIVLPVLLLAVGVGGFLLAKQKQSTQLQSVVAAKAIVPDPVAEALKQVVPVAQVKVTTPVAEIKSTPIPAPTVAASTPAPAPADISTTGHAAPAPTTQAAPTPAQPAPAPASTGPTFHLKGILYTKNPTALINDGSVEIGGEIDGAKVTKIDRTSVELSYQGKITILKLGSR